jgi:hypothetical protein
LVGAKLLGIANALQVVGECVQDGVLQQLCVDSLWWQLEWWLLLLEDGIQRWMHFHAIYLVRKLHRVLLELVIQWWWSSTHRRKGCMEAG